MTSYSVMPMANKYAVLATWPMVRSDRSAKVTTLEDEEAADVLTWELTRLSENMWTAAWWLDSYSALEELIAELAERLRDLSQQIDYPSVRRGGHRHETSDIFLDIESQLREDLPFSLDQLSRPRRLSVADELVIDAEHRAAMLSTLAAGQEPEDTSRGWQAGEVGRVTRTGLYGGLPDGGPGWLLRCYRNENLLSRQWQARSQLLRIEQLISACQLAGGRGTCEDDLELYCAFNDPSKPTSKTIYKIFPDRHHPLAPSPGLPMVVKRDGDVLGRVNADDDAGFLKLLGGWAAGAGGAWWKP
jgi:hypothetical protein